MAQGGGQHSSTPIPKIGVNGRDGTELGVTLLVRNGAVAMCVLGAKAPAACLPEGALLLDVVGV